MYQNYTFDSINQAIPSLFEELLTMGRSVQSRNGDTLELPFTGITLYDSMEREILVPGRKHNLAAQIAETMWVLSGRNDIEWLSAYLPRAKDYSDDGETWRGAYGRRLRSFGADANIDQIQHVVGLLKTSPETRQAVISIYDPNIDTAPGKDIPCNDFLHFLARENILDLHIFVRSNDMMWGWSGINVFEWSSLLEVVAGLAGMEIGALHFSVSSFHLYEQHWQKAQQIVNDTQVAEYRRLEMPPRFDAGVVGDVEDFHNLCHQWFIIEQTIRKQANNLRAYDRGLEELIDFFPEPMLRSWLRVLAWWWTSEAAYLKPIIGTRLFASAEIALQPLARLSVVPEPKPDLIDEVIALHNEKDAAYGDSWCRRGEMLGIMANIARKIDRLGGLSTRDETSLDTATDLFVYLGKYRAWIDDEGADVANAVLRTVAEKAAQHGPVEYTQEYLEGALREQFEDLEKAVMENNSTIREVLIASMLENAWSLVVLLAEAE